MIASRLYRIIALWISLCFLLLPYDYAFLPQVGVFVSEQLLFFTKWLCNTFGVDVQSTFSYSDSLAMYVLVFTLAPISLLINYIIILLYSDKNWLQVVNSINLIFLAFFLIYYGIDKLLLKQFYTPSGNILHSKVGSLDKDMLYWTAMGTSRFYNYFMGGLEVVAGLLLFSSKFRFLGLLASTAIFLNVVAINFGFDISVKLLSTLLLVNALVLLSNFKEQIGNMLGKEFVVNRNNQFLIAKKLLILSFIPFVVEICILMVNVENRANGLSFLVTLSDNLKDENFENLKRIHLHPSNFLVFEYDDNNMKSYPLGPNNRTIKMRGNYVPISINHERLVINNSFVGSLVPIPLKEMPLLRDDCHLFIEQIK